MSGVVIRASRPTDLPAVADLRWRWSVVEGGETPTSSIAAHRAAMAAFAAAHTETHRCVVAERDGVLVGMGWLALTARPPTPTATGRLTADVQTVYVLPTARGDGVASRIVAALLVAADEAGAERTSVHSSAAGERLYRGLGFGSAPRLLQRPPED